MTWYAPFSKAVRLAVERWWPLGTEAEARGWAGDTCAFVGSRPRPFCFGPSVVSANQAESALTLEADGA